MKKSIYSTLTLLSLSSVVFASTPAIDYKTQSFNKEFIKVDESISLEGHRYYRTGMLKSSDVNCEQSKKARAEYVTSRGTDQFNEAKRVMQIAEKKCYVNVVKDSEGKLMGIEFLNETNNAINPKTKDIDSSREYRFSFEERSARTVKLEITENSGLTGKMSHDFLETTIVLLPRINFPYITSKKGDGKTVDLVLNTGELIQIDSYTNEIISGPIKETKMDLTASRHKRKFVGFQYEGKGLMIRADRRAGTPEHNYNVAYNVNEKIKHAIVTHKGKECLVPKSEIWVNADDADKGAYLKYGHDKDMLELVINPICKWNLTMKDIL